MNLQKNTPAIILKKDITGYWMQLDDCRPNRSRLFNEPIYGIGFVGFSGGVRFGKCIWSILRWKQAVFSALCCSLPGKNSFFSCWRHGRPLSPEQMLFQ